MSTHEMSDEPSKSIYESASAATMLKHWIHGAIDAAEPLCRKIMEEGKIAVPMSATCASAWLEFIAASNKLKEAQEGLDVAKQRAVAALNALSGEAAKAT